MRADDLLTEIEPLAFRDRCRRLADLRRHAGDPALAALLDELGGRDHYKRSVALFVASAVRDEASVAHLAGAIGDPDTELACRAITLAVRYGAAPRPFLDGLDDAPEGVRTALYDAVRRWRPAGLADALIGRVAERWGDQEAAALLPACAPETVAGRIDALAHAVGNWASLGHAHPRAVLDHAERALAALPDGMWSTWWFRHEPGVAAAVRHDPGRVVGLLERHCAAASLPHGLYPAAGALMDAEPERMLRLLLVEAHRADLRALLNRRSFRDRLARFGDGDLTAVARAVREDDHALCLLLKAFPPGRRAAVFDAAMRGVDLGTAELGEPLLDVLPREVRTREARRMLGLRRVAASPERVRSVTAFLPFEEARPVLEELTRRPDADERATGYALLIRCAGRERTPAALAAALESSGRLRNEQDPVRLSALDALASVPEGLLRAEHGAAIARLAEDALGARDSSPMTRYELARLASALCRQGAVRDDAALLESGLELIERLAGGTGTVHLGRLDRALRRGREHRLAELLAPRLAAAARRDDHRLALMLVRALGRRAHRVPILQDGLEAALDAREDAVIREAIRLWLAPPGTRAERVGRVVARDPSAVAVPAVLAAVARERTDLLHLVLTRDTPPGRFHRADVVYVPRMRRSWMRRWTARQRDAYLDLLERAAADEEAPSTQRGGAVSAMAEVPGIDAARLRPHLASGDPHLRRRALTALPWTASPQDVLPDLLAHAGSDDAHVAVYAAARAARFVPPSALAAALGPVLRDGKITARKEAVRILLDNRVPDALAIIAAAWDDPGQHRDVRAAIASAVRARLDDPVARRILAEAAEGPRDLARQVLGTPPALVEERFRGDYAALVMRVVRSPDPEARDAALSSVPLWARWAPDAPALLARLAGDLGETSAWRPALYALVRCVTMGTGAAELGAAVAALAAGPDEPDAGPERDLPASQRLTALLGTVREFTARNRALGERAVRAVEDRLPEPLASELAAATLRWDDPGAADAVDALADRCRGGGVLRARLVAEALAAGPSPAALWTAPDPADVRPHAARLAARGDLAGGLFACALTAAHAPRAGWPEEWRALLRALRAHADQDVVFTARGMLTAGE
ncbi:hypothetical protein [Actinomadura welshii]|uniref:hypothetical protein n=1 Tax=Actinomadura welshii TaxID=3103817 RepID=UPI0004631CA9|nr:hypothetical protein [Actinomadura madurae]